jgi:hypothetical protein
MRHSLWWAAQTAKEDGGEPHGAASIAWLLVAIVTWRSSRAGPTFIMAPIQIEQRMATLLAQLGCSRLAVLPAPPPWLKSEFIALVLSAPSVLWLIFHIRKSETQA